MSLPVFRSGKFLNELFLGFPGSPFPSARLLFMQVNTFHVGITLERELNVFPFVHTSPLLREDKWSKLGSIEDGVTVSGK